jgi:predicted nuclease of predicted toxin-antitoxin system
MTRVLLDQGVPWTAANLLRGAGWDAVHVSELGMSRSTDRSILEHAGREARAIITLDGDFHALLAVANASRPSVIRIRREGLRATDVVSLLMDIWPRVRHQIENGAMVTVTAHSIRLHKLPLLPHTTP